MRVSVIRPFRSFATTLALLGVPPCFQRLYLAGLSPAGFVSPRSRIWGTAVELGKNVFIDDDVLIFLEPSGASITLGNRARLMEDTHLLAGIGGNVSIGDDTNIHRGCQLNGYLASIQIGERVDIAARCAFYSYDHGVRPGSPIASQPLTSRGNIVVGDEAWIGYGVIVLSGVQIGSGAVIGAGSVVTRDIPDGAIAAGTPARVLRFRSDVGG